MIPSQLSPGDSQTLQDVMHLFPDYTYMEIGSYLGGSLQWHLTNSCCKHVYSIDKRSTSKILDERNIDYAYSATTQDMLDLLAEHNLPTDRLTTIDGTILNVPNILVDLIFVDGEHTNLAALSDATNSLRFKPSVILFHDDWIVHQGLVSFRRYLDLMKAPYDCYKIKGSDITAFAFGKFRDSFAAFAMHRTVDWEEFLAAANIKLKDTQ